MAPRHVSDYVVVHEMCHMVHMNHDRSFWRLVGKIMPDYREQENWLENVELDYDGIVTAKQKRAEAPIGILLFFIFNYSDIFLNLLK